MPKIVGVGAWKKGEGKIIPLFDAQSLIYLISLFNLKHLLYFGD